MTFPSDHSPTCSWCGAVLPSSREVFCNEDCQGKYNDAADELYARRHAEPELEVARVAGQPIPGAAGPVDWFDLATRIARAGVADALARGGLKHD